MQYACNFTVDNININCKLARHVLHINLIDSSSLHIGSVNLIMHQGLLLMQEMHMLVLFCGAKEGDVAFSLLSRINQCFQYSRPNY